MTPNLIFFFIESDLRDNCSRADHFSPRVGDFCCAKFTGDGNWYRAVVLQARSSLNKSDGVDGSGERKTIINVEVFYIDFGNIESLGVENLRDLLPRFMELPAQVVRCSLADVEPLAKCTAGPDEVFVGKCFLLLFGWFFISFIKYQVIN